MYKKIIAMIGSIIMTFSALNVYADYDTTTISEKKVFLYPIFTSLSVKQDVPQGTEGATENKQYILDDDENALSVSFQFKSESDKKDIMFVSLYDVTEDRYVTSDKGVPVSADKCFFTGLTPRHEYIIRTSALFSEKIVDVTIEKLAVSSDEKSDNLNIIGNANDFGAYDFDIISEELKSLDIITGYEDGSVRPDNNITRAEVCAVINRTIRQGTSSMNSASFSDCFSDVQKDEWFYNDVMKSSDFGIINGYDDNTFKPANDITYNEYIKIVSSLMFCEPYAKTNGGYPDGYISAAKELGLTKNISFNGNDKITRKDAMIILDNAIKTPIPLVKTYNVGNVNEYETSNIAYMDFIR